MPICGRSHPPYGRGNGRHAVRPVTGGFAELVAASPRGSIGGPALDAEGASPFLKTERRRMKRVWAMVLLCAAGAVLRPATGNRRRAMPGPALRTRRTASASARGGAVTEFFFTGQAGRRRATALVRDAHACRIDHGRGEALLEQVEAEIHGRDNDVTTIRAERAALTSRRKRLPWRARSFSNEDHAGRDGRPCLARRRTVARTEKPVRILDEGAELGAENLEFHPDEGALLLDNLTGDVTLAGRTEP